MNEASPDDLWTRKSWIESANEPAVGFPLQSLPYCAFAAADEVHLGVGIGLFVLDLHLLSASGLLASLDPRIQQACRASQLNDLMHCGSEAWSELRGLLTQFLRDDASADMRRALEPLLLPAESAKFVKPVIVGDYTDFYASIHHATNVGKLFRPDQPLLPNYKWIPIGYHGRASSLVVSGTEVRRPHGQVKLPNEDSPGFLPTNQLDYELEVAAYIGTGNPLGEPVPIASASGHIFGLSLLNDWSARDIQSWEYQPLGPFLGKNFATSVSPWVVPLDALQPFRTAPEARQSSDPKPLPYLDEASSNPTGSFDITLEVWLSTTKMRSELATSFQLGRSNLQNLYWTFGQMIAHHTSNGCNLNIGDLLGSGTVSGPQPGSQGCLIEITRRGASPLHLPNGEVRTYLEDGDEITILGFCEKEGLPRIGLGECRGVISGAIG
jgi:fumarylacetoacetase